MPRSSGRPALNHWYNRSNLIDGELYRSLSLFKFFHISIACSLDVGINLCLSTCWKASTLRMCFRKSCIDVSNVVLPSPQYRIATATLRVHFRRENTTPEEPETPLPPHCGSRCMFPFGNGGGILHGSLLHQSYFPLDEIQILSWCKGNEAPKRWPLPRQRADPDHSA